MEEIIKTILHPGGKARVLIVKRANGMFGYEYEEWSDEAQEQCW